MPDLDEAIATVKAAGYVVLKEKSYRQAQERQRVAEALRKLEQEHNEHTRAWANKAFDEQRHLRDRCEYLYGLAAKLGAGDRQLRGEPCKWCNDEGIVHTHDGQIIGPCKCTRTEGENQ